MLNGATTHELKTDAVKNERERERERKKERKKKRSGWIQAMITIMIYSVATRKSSDWLWLCVCDFCLGYD